MNPKGGGEGLFEPRLTSLPSGNTAAAASPNNAHADDQNQSHPRAVLNYRMHQRRSRSRCARRLTPLFLQVQGFKARNSVWGNSHPGPLPSDGRGNDLWPDSSGRTPGGGFCGHKPHSAKKLTAPSPGTNLLQQLLRMNRVAPASRPAIKKLAVRRRLNPQPGTAALPWHQFRDTSRGIRSVGDVPGVLRLHRQPPGNIISAEFHQSGQQPLDDFGGGVGIAVRRQKICDVGNFIAGGDQRQA